MNIKELDRLLELFYSGDSTPEQEDRLACLLSRREDIPQGYEDDARVVAALREAKASVPADLEQRILASTVERGHRPERLNWRAVAALAASVAVLVVLGISVLFSGREETAVEGYVEVLVAQEPVKVIFAEVDDEATAVEAKPVVEPRQSGAEVKTVAAPAPRHREIDDPEEAAALMQAVVAKLGNTLAMADKGIQTAYTATEIMANPIGAAQILD